MNRRRAPVLALVALLASVGCKDEPKHEGTPPPPPPPPSASSSAGACAGGGGTVTDAPSSAFFPKSTQGYCVDPPADTKSFGDKGKPGSKELCNPALDGGCEG